MDTPAKVENDLKANGQKYFGINIAEIPFFDIKSFRRNIKQILFDSDKSFSLTRVPPRNKKSVSYDESESIVTDDDSSRMSWTELNLHDDNVAVAKAGIIFTPFFYINYVPINVSILTFDDLYF